MAFPWIAVALVALSLISLYLTRPKPGEEVVRTRAFGSESFPVAEEGRPIAILWGTDRIRAPNMIWFAEPNVRPLNDVVLTSPITSETITIGFEYRASLQLGICLGQETGSTRRYKKIFFGERLIWDGDPLTFTPEQVFPFPDTIRIPDSDRQLDLRAVGAPDQSRSGPYLFETTGVAPGGLVAGQTYFLLRFTNQGTIAVFENEITGTFIDLTSQGTGVHSFDPNFAGHRIKVQKREFWGGLGAGGGIGKLLGASSSGNGTIHLHFGTFPQDPNPVLLEKLSGDPGNIKFPPPNYNGLMYAVFEFFLFGESATPAPISFEMSSIPDTLGHPEVNGVAGPDANPAELLYDLLTEPWGRLGLPTSEIDTASFLAAAITLDGEGNGMSITVHQAVTATDVIEQVLRQIDGLLYEDPDDQLIKLVLIRDIALPATLPLFDESNIAEFVEFKTQTWNETFNQVRVQFPDRSRNYTSRTAFAQDMANFTFQGSKIRSLDLNFPGVRNGTLANKLVGRELKAVSIPNTGVRFVASREAIDLRPGDGFRLSWSEYSLSEAVFRVLRVDFGDLQNGEIKIDAALDKFDEDRGPYGVTVGEFGDELVDPSDIAPSPFEVPFWLGLQATNEATQVENADDSHVFYLLQNPGGEAQFFKPEASEDATNFGLDIKFSQVSEFTKSAQVDSTYLKTEGPFDVSTGLVICGVSNEASFLVTATEDEIREGGKNLFKIGDEFLSYESFTDLGGGRFRLNSIWRGLLDTVSEDHAPSATVFFIQPSGLQSLGRQRFVGDELVTSRSRISTGLRELDPESTLTTQLQLIKRPRLAPRAHGTTVDGTIPFREMDENEFVIAYLERLRTSTVIVRGDDLTETPEAGTEHHIEAKLEPDTVFTELDTDGISPRFVELGPVAWGLGTIRVNAMQTVDSVLSDAFVGEQIDADFRHYRQLLVNPHFDDASAGRGWVTVAGTPVFGTTAPLGDQGRAFDTATAATCTIEQVVDVTGLDIIGKDVRLEFYAQNRNTDSSDTVRARIDVENSGGSSQANAQTLITPTLDQWDKTILTLSDVPDDVVQIRITLTLSAVDPPVSDTTPDAAVDGLDLRVGEFTVDGVTNGDAEAAKAGWTDDVGTWFSVGTTKGTDPLAGIRMFIGPVGSATTIAQFSQAFALPGSPSTGDVAWIRWWQANMDTLDEGRVILEALSAASEILATVETDFEEITPEDVWEVRNLYLPLPVGATQLRIKLQIDRDTGAADYDVAFDDIQVHVIKERVRYPRDGQQLDDFMARVGVPLLVTSKPIGMWRFNQESGDSVDLSGRTEIAADRDLSPAGTPTQGTIDSELDTRNLDLADATSERMETSDTAGLDIGPDAFALLWIGKIETVPAADRILMQKFAASIGYQLILTSAGSIDFVANTTTETLVAGIVGGDVIRILAVLDPDEGFMKVFSDTHGQSPGQVISGTIDVSNTSVEFMIGGDSSDSPDALVTMAAIWQSGGDPFVLALNNANLRQLVTSLDPVDAHPTPQIPIVPGVQTPPPVPAAGSVLVLI